ncbi:MAG: reverse transcriptase family protein, partial [Ignavibacteria bacterium]|nr:reverse transcriptase family protein [Ignavibacteria bacterium]
MIKIKEPIVLLEKLNDLIKSYDNFIVKLITDGAEGYYRKFFIPKRGGGVRIIESPENDTLRILLKKLNYIFATELIFPDSVTGFVKTKSIVTNATIHLGAGLIINIDLKDFFYSIKKNNISDALNSQPFNFSNDLADLLSSIATKENYLPQGSPLSPIISNIVANKLDKNLSEFCLRKGIKYSRYADDMTFSITNGRIEDEDIMNIRKEIELSGFQFNEKKYKIKRKNKCLAVTGIIINKKLNVKRTYIK